MKTLQEKYHDIITGVMTTIRVDANEADLRLAMNSEAPRFSGPRSLNIWLAEVEQAVHEWNKRLTDGAGSVKCPGGDLTRIPLQKPHIPLPAETRVQQTFL